jgi:RimJ/RimL family protein N-acetyltransferase
MNAFDCRELNGCRRAGRCWRPGLAGGHELAPPRAGVAALPPGQAGGEVFDVGLDLPRPRTGLRAPFSRELAGFVTAAGRTVVIVDSGGFHHVRARRYRQGREPAQGYYDDAYDLGSLAERVLLPLGPGGGRGYAIRVHDLASDARIDDETARAPADAIVLFAATFIQRGRLRDLWDEVIYPGVPQEAAIARGVARDAGALGGSRPPWQRGHEALTLGCMHALTTARLELPPWRDSFEEGLARLAADERVVRYVGDGQPWSAEHARERHQACLRHWEEHGFGWRATLDGPGGRFLGVAALSYLGALVPGIAESAIEIGWWLDPGAWGQGMATEAAAAIRDVAGRLGEPVRVYVLDRPG